MALKLSKEAFIVYVVYLGLQLKVHFGQKVEIALLIIKKIVIAAKYLDFANIFGENSAM